MSPRRTPAGRSTGYRRWHLLHYLACAAFALSLAHPIAMSAEVQSLGLVGIAVFGCAVACVLLWELRILPATTAVGLRIAPKEA
jgi:methionine sulfoxide reductase heme-binding subunit